MKHEKVGLGASDTGPNSLLAGGESSLPESGKNLNLKAALSAADGSGVRILKSEFSRYLGGARVVISQRNGLPFVCVNPQPWGWTNTGKECLSDVGADRYAAKLLARIESEGRKEFERRERLIEARLRERAQ